MASLVKKLQSLPELFKTVVAVTGQHRQMLDQMLRIFDIVPDYDLNIMQANQDLYDATSRVLVGMRDVLRAVQPDVVLVMRNTTERPEAVEAGTVLLVGTDKAKIEQGVIDLIEKPEVYRKMSEAVNPYGDGHACERISTFLANV